MIRTQIQLPDELHRQLKRIAQTREWSYAEVIRRGMERYVASCRVEDVPQSTWSFPTLPPREMLADPADFRNEAMAVEERLK